MNVSETFTAFHKPVLYVLTSITIMKEKVDCGQTLTQSWELLVPQCLLHSWGLTLVLPLVKGEVF
jgi:hypothetical protein